MALTSQTTGCVYPGNNAKTVYKYKADTDTDLYTVPSGRILYVSDGNAVRVKYNNNLPTDQRGGSTSGHQCKPFWVTGGLTLETSSGGGFFIGVEIDA